tara:strand:- start:405 stop:644 length:240 start_codon:yes stop_codon:yes gene_type:complete
MATLKDIDIRKDLVNKIKGRLLLGADRYGGPLPLNDGRNFQEETLEELLDAIIYLTAYLIQITYKDKHEQKNICKHCNR